MNHLKTFEKSINDNNDYTGFTEYTKDYGNIPIFIDELKIDKYEHFLLKDDIEMFNL